MSYEVFDRRYSLIVGRLSTNIVNTLPRYISKVAVPRYLAATKIIDSSQGLGDTSNGIGFHDYRTIPDKFIEIRDLGMRATIVYSKSGSNGGNQSSVIYLDNLTEDTKNSIRVNDMLFLRAGYKIDIGNRDVDYDDLPLLLASQVKSVTTTRDSSTGTYITKIVCADNNIPKKSLKFSKSWPKNTTKKQVLEDMLLIAKSNFVPVGKVQIKIGDFQSPVEDTYPFGYSAAGNLFEEISKFCDGMDYRFYTVLGKLYVEPKGVAQYVETFILEPETLKAPLERQGDNSKETQGSKVKDEGIVARTFLNGRVQANMAISIENVGQDFNGTYPIESISHNLDFEGNAWDTIIKTRKLQG